jgi:hypothetical protein
MVEFEEAFLTTLDIAERSWVLVPLRKERVEKKSQSPTVLIP